MKSKTIFGALFFSALVSLCVYIFFRQYAFPEHSIQFSIDEHQAQAKAEDLANQLEFNILNYRKVTLFEIDDTAKSYLEREIGAKQTGDLARSEVNLWYFTTRLFQTQQKEELFVSHAPDGRLVYFSHEIDENLKGEALTKEQAQPLVQQFLSTNCSLCQRTNFPEGWAEVQYDNTSRKNRLDHSFIYERKNYALKEARQRVSVELAGDKVIGFNEYLKVPQHWISEFRKEKSYNDVAQLVAELISTFCITLPLIVIFFRKFKSRKLLFRIPYIAAIVLSAISLSEIVNSFYQYYFNYPTTQSPTTVLVLLVFGLALTWIFTFITNEATLAVAESMFREVFPQKKNTIFTIKNMLRLPSVTNAIFVGACVGIIFFLYELLYYFLGRQLGFWVPAEVNYSDAFNSIAPWLYPLTIGLIPAVTEEVTYRLFGISLYTKFVSRWVKNQKRAIILAVVLSSFTWSFLHSAYPQMPFFVRGIELGVVGFAFSWLFLRYGILSSIAAHYSFNALQMAIFFLDSKSNYAATSAILVALLPFWIVLLSLFVQHILKKKLSEENIPLNENSDPVNPGSTLNEKIEVPVSIQPPASPLTTKTKVIIILLTLLSLGLLDIYKTNIAPSDQLTQEDQVSFVNRSIASERASSYLERKGVATGAYMQVATVESLGEDSTARNYVRKNTDPSTGDYFLNKNREPDRIWKVRFFKPQSREEYLVKLFADGGVYTYNHILEEKAPGSLLSSGEAEQKAKKYLAENVKDAPSFRLINSENLKRDYRNDYRFTFEDTEKVADASRRISIDVIDAQPLNLQNYIKVPEQFERTSEEISTKQLLLMIGSSLLGLIIVLLLSNTLYRIYKEGQLRNPAGKLIAGVVVTFAIISQLNHFPVFFASYDTDLPIWVYTVFQLIESITAIAITFILSLLSINCAVALYTKYIGPLLPREITFQKKLYSNALFLVVTLNIIGVCILFASVSLSEKLFPEAGTTAAEHYVSTPDGIETYIPVLEGLKNSTRPVVVVAVFMLFIGTLRLHFRSWKRVGALFGSIAIGIFFMNDWTTQDLLSGIIALGPVILYTYIAWRYIVRNNIFFYLLTVYFILMGLQTLSYLTEPDNFLRLNGIVYLGFMSLPLIFWPCYTRIAKVLQKKYYPVAPDTVSPESQDGLSSM